MRVASEIILALSIEQEASGHTWPHPWDHYPFMTEGKYIWLRYRDLDAAQREQLGRALVRIARRLAAVPDLTGPG